MIITSDNRQLQNLIDPGQLWSLHYGTSPLPDKQRAPGASIVTVCLTSLPSVSYPLNPYQRHIKTPNVASFAFAGMRLQGPHGLTLIADFSYLLYTVCAHNPAITNVSHKTIHCLQQGSQQPTRPLLPP